MTSKGGRSKKRRGRPGVVAPSTKAGAKPHRPPLPAGDVTPEKPAGGVVKPDRDPSLQQWTVSTWLMLASAMWSTIVVWQLLTSGDDPAFAGEGPPWLLTLAGVTAAIASATAFWMLRKGSTERVRRPIIIAAVAGVFAVFSTLVSLVSLWLVRRANR